MAFENHFVRTKYWLTVGISHLPASRSYFVLGHGRSGTNWLANLFSHYFGIPAYRPWAVGLPSFGPVVLNMHRFAIDPTRTVYIHRDGRDVVASNYFEVLNTFPRGTRNFETLESLCEVELTRENARANLPGFIDWQFRVNKAASRPWDRHIREAYRRKLFIIRYEDLFTNTEKALTSAVNHLTRAAADPEKIRAAIDEYSFTRVTGRKPGVEDRTAHTRKGVSGDWKNYFGHEAARAFDRYAGDVLIECGYEEDHGWVDEVVGPSP